MYNTAEPGSSMCRKEVIRWGLILGVRFNLHSYCFCNVLIFIQTQFFPEPKQKFGLPQHSCHFGIHRQMTYSVIRYEDVLMLYRPIYKNGYFHLNNKSSFSRLDDIDFITVSSVAQHDQSGESTLICSSVQTKNKNGRMCWKMWEAETPHSIS